MSGASTPAPDHPLSPWVGHGNGAPADLTCLFLALALDEVRRGVWPITNELLTHFEFDFATHYHTTCLYNCGKDSTFDQSLSDLFRQCSIRLFLLAPGVADSVASVFFRAERMVSMLVVKASSSLSLSSLPPSTEFSTTSWMNFSPGVSASSPTNTNLASSLASSGWHGPVVPVLDPPIVPAGLSCIPLRETCRRAIVAHSRAET